MTKKTSDQELVAACLKHHARAQRALYDRYVTAMYSTVYRYTCNHHDTQDILQNGFTRVFQHLQTFDAEKGNLLAWMRKIHIRCALDFLQRKRNVFLDLDESIPVADSHAVADEILEAEYILTFIEELQPRDRVIFNMYHIEGYSHELIAEMLSINVNSSRVYLARARKLLRERILAYSTTLSLAQ